MDCLSDKCHSARLHFANLGGVSKKPRKMSAEDIACKLAAHGVRSAVLKACQAATVTTSPGINIAYAFATHGVHCVMAMHYKVHVDAAVMAMNHFYTRLLEVDTNFSKAVHSARTGLRTKTSRTARYGMNVDCADDCNIVCYQRRPVDLQSGFQGAKHVLDPPSHGLLSAVPPPPSTGACPSSGTAFIHRTQDLDILSVETLLASNKVVYISGRAGLVKQAWPANCNLGGVERALPRPWYTVKL